MEAGGASAYVLLNGSPLSPGHLRLVRKREGVPVVVADGAANLLIATLPSLVPNFIVGDFDSADPDVLQHFKERGAELLHRPSLTSCDFTKAMNVAVSHGDTTSKPIVVLGGHPTCGRIDQFLGNVQELCSRAEEGLDVWWVSENTATMLLGAGRHRLAVNASREGPMCGLAPVCGAVTRVTTRGLRWNLMDQEMKFGLGGVVSSSNEVVDAVVDIECSGMLLWTCDVKK